MNFFYRWETSNTACRSFAMPQFLSKHRVTKHVAVSRLQNFLVKTSCFVCWDKKNVSVTVKTTSSYDVLLLNFSKNIFFITLISVHFIFLYKRLGSGFRPQSCLFFQVFQGSKLLNRCLVV